MLKIYDTGAIDEKKMQEDTPEKEELNNSLVLH